MTASTSMDLTRIARLPTGAGFGSALRREATSALEMTPDEWAAGLLRQRKQRLHEKALQSARAAIDRAETLLLGS